MTTSTMIAIAQDRQTKAAAVHARKTQIALDLKAKFEAAGFTVKNTEAYTLWVAGRTITVTQQMTGDEWHKHGNGKFTVNLVDAHYKPKRFNERQGQIDYDAVIQFFKEAQDVLAQEAIADEQRRQLDRSIVAMMNDNDLPSQIRLHTEPKLAVRVECNDLDQMRRIAQAVKAILAEG